MTLKSEFAIDFLNPNHLIHDELMLEIICEFSFASGWYLFYKSSYEICKSFIICAAVCVLSICMLVYITLRLVLQCCVPECDVLSRRFG